MILTICKIIFHVFTIMSAFTKKRTFNLDSTDSDLDLALSTATKNVHKTVKTDLFLLIALIRKKCHYCY